MEFFQIDAWLMTVYLLHHTAMIATVQIPFTEFGLHRCEIDVMDNAKCKQDSGLHRY